MQTQVLFTTDELLKEKALEKARNEGITLKALLTLAMKNFVEGKLAFDLRAVPEEPDVEEVFFDSPRIQRNVKKIDRVFE
ncbi:MAG: hypothetical protein Q8P56_04070 [Candidatus Uhrbacteria bacterium]|nr:hypothetical protein [Candidatus Uhrbacteria bacterium]